MSEQPNGPADKKPSPHPQWYEPIKPGEFPELDRLEAQTAKINTWLAVIVLVVALAGWIGLVMLVVFR